LIPADEWIGSFFGHVTYGPNLDGLNYLDVDSVTFPKKPVYAPVRTRSPDNLESQYTETNVGPIHLEGERRMRIWFVATHTEHPGGVPHTYGKHTYAETIQLSMGRQYFSAIGEDL
jgi:hypothetical protein